MIHSMSGGVLSEFDNYTFVKVVFDDSPTPYWYVTDLELSAGNRVLAPFGAGGVGKAATVVKVEDNVSGQVAPVPVKRVKRIIKKL